MMQAKGKYDGVEKGDETPYYDVVDRRLVPTRTCGKVGYDVHIRLLISFQHGRYP